MRSRLALALLLGVLAAEPRAQPGADYLPGELRARVEKLKADLATTPSNATNREERARVLWDWANAHALRGGTLPVELTRTVAGVFAYPDFNGGSEDQLDRYVREMILLDQEPEALGELTADSGPFEAGAYVSINQTFTVGSRPIQPGGGFLVARHFMANYGMWQTRDAKADNYVSIRSTNPRVSFASGTLPVAGMHGGLLDSQDQLVFRLASGALHSGDEVTITYGDRSQGSRGFRMADFASDRMPLPLYVAFSANGDFFTLPIQPIQVTGTTLAGVLAFAPSIVAANEPFDLVVRARDRYYNRARDGHPDWRVKLNGQIQRGFGLIQ